MKRYIALGFFLILLLIGSGCFIRSCAADSQTEEERLENINVEPEPEYEEDGRGEIIDNTPKDTFDDVEDIEDAGDEPFQGGDDAGEKPSE